MVFLLLAVLGQPLIAQVDVVVVRAEKLDWFRFDPSMALVRSGIPTAEEIADLSDGTLKYMRFDTTATVFENACVDWLGCATAMQQTCVTLGVMPATLGGTVNCEGTCDDGTRVKILCE